MPLVPLVAAALGVALEKAKTVGRVTVALSALFCSAFPLLVAKLPGLMSGNRDAHAPTIPLALAMTVFLTLAALWLVRDRTASIALVAVLASVSYVWIKAETFPFIDRAGTARPLWRQIEKRRAETCVHDLPRGWRYGLNYYSVTPLPDCSAAPSRETQLSFRNHTAVIVGMPAK